MEQIDVASYRRMEEVFVDGYRAAQDTTLFLRVSHIPFELVGPPDAASYRYLVAVEISETVRVGSVMPAVGSDELVHQVLPHGLVERHLHLRFVYAHTEGTVELRLADLHGLEVVEDPGQH